MAAIKIWNSILESWGTKTLKVWNGATWVTPAVKVWNGAAWQEVQAKPK